MLYEPAITLMAKIILESDFVSKTLFVESQNHIFNIKYRKNPKTLCICMIKTDNFFKISVGTYLKTKNILIT